MQTEIFYDKNNDWAFVEKWNVYNYKGKGYCDVLVGFDGHDFVEPCLTVRNEIVPISEQMRIKGCAMTKESGRNFIETYLRAKDRICSKIGDCLLLSLRIYMDYAVIDNPKIKYPYFPRKTIYSVYKPLGYDTYFDEGDNTEKYVLNWEKIEDDELPQHIKDAISNCADKLSAVRNKRANFLYARCYTQRQARKNGNR